MTFHPAVPNLRLNDGVEIPQLGFGVFQIDPEKTVNIVSRALMAGYRHIDTAKSYANEAEVGEAVRAFNERVFVTTKYFNPDHNHGYEDAKAAFDESFQQLNLEYIDLYLIHWPVLSKDRYIEAWKAFIELRDSGRMRSIGVSNFQASHLERIVNETGVSPAVNQIELHPYFQQSALRREHASRGIVTEAWAPLAQGKVIEDPTLVNIGKAHGKSAAQIVLRWHIQLGNVIFPKPSTSERMRENFDIFDFSLTADEMSAIERLDRGERIGPDPNTFVFPPDYRGKAHVSDGSESPKKV